MARVGDTRSHRGQFYTAIESFERTNARGGTSIILRWLSCCAQCGEVFYITTPAASSKFEPNRRCQKHKRPGARVREVRS